MRFLVDNQLPPALAVFLRHTGHDADHVVDLGMAGADDREIWEHARKQKAVLISKDEDFLHLSLTDPTGSPFIWIRIGNCRKPALLAAISAHLPDILVALSAGQRIIEIH